MLFRIVPPAPALRPFVQHYLLVHLRYDGVDPRQAIKPMPPQCLAISFVNVVGIFWQGEADVQRAHQVIFDCLYKEVKLPRPTRTR